MEYSTQRDMQWSAGQATCRCFYPSPSSHCHQGDAQLSLPPLIQLLPRASLGSYLPKHCSKPHFPLIPINSQKRAASCCLRKPVRSVPCIPDANRGLDMHSRDCVVITKLLHPPEQGRSDLSCTGSTRDSKTLLLVLVLFFFFWWGGKNRFVGHFPPQYIFQPPPSFGAGCQPCVLPSKIWIPPKPAYF